MEETLNTDAKRTRLLKFVTEVVDEKIEALYLLLEDQVSEYELEIPEQEWQAMEASYQAYLRGETQGVSWEELRERLTGKQMAA